MKTFARRSSGVGQFSSGWSNRIKLGSVGSSLVWTRSCLPAATGRSFSRHPQHGPRKGDYFVVETPIEEGWTPPSSWYTSPEVFELEKDTIFSRNWLYVGRTDQVKDKGQFFTGEILDQPYIISRGEDGVLRCFFNVCRHHANILVSESHGCKKEFVCCYHGWTYSLEGKLTKATKLKGIKDFKPKEFGLHEIPLTEWGPFIFIHMGPHSVKTEHPMTPDQVPSLHTQLAPLKKEIDASFGDLSNMRWMASKTFTVACNWKVVNDNYLDGEYHIPYVHPGLNSQLDMSTYETKLFDGYSVQYAETAKGDQKQASEVSYGQDFHQRVGDQRVIYAMLYPTFAINRYGNMMDTNHVIPLGPNKTAIVFDFFFEEDLLKSLSEVEAKDYVEKSLAAAIQVQDEDSGVCENLQRGLTSKGYDKGRYAPSVELGTHHFHQWVSRNLYPSHK